MSIPITYTCFFFSDILDKRPCLLYFIVTSTYLVCNVLLFGNHNASHYTNQKGAISTVRFGVILHPVIHTGLAVEKKDFYNEYIRAYL